MSKLTELVERLKALPEKKRLRQASEAMKVYCARLEESVGRLKDSVAICRAVSTIMPDVDVDRALDHIKKASRKSSSLFKRLSSTDESGRYDVEGIVSTVNLKKTDATITEIGEHGQGVMKFVKELWLAKLEEHVSPYRQLCQVAQRLPVRGGDELSGTLARLENKKSSPPTTVADADAVNMDIADLKRSIESLGLQGEAGKFLIRAADGRADPQDLFKDEVKRFFDKDPQLWKLLRVTL